VSEIQTEKPIFTYAQAQALLPRVQQLTGEAHQRVARLLDAKGENPETREQAQSIVNAWAAEMTSLGLDIKGLWLVDFDNGSGYYCWKHPEPTLDYYHTYEEGFGGRVRIQ
jgi:hypothetical protein